MATFEFPALFWRARVIARADDLTFHDLLFQTAAKGTKKRQLALQRHKQRPRDVAILSLRLERYRGSGWHPNGPYPNTTLPPRTSGR